MYGIVARLTDDELPLQRVYRWERERPNRLFLTQPLGGGRLREWTWSQAAGEIRRVARYLKAQGWEPGSHVAILSKNSAWWVMADLAIWMAGHVSVPVYPSLRPSTVRQVLEHSGAKACFVGLTDEKDAAAAGIPPGVLTIRFPNAGAAAGQEWETIVAGNPPLADNVTRGMDDLATIFYTSGTTGAPKGVMHRFSAFAFLAKTLAQRLDLTGEHRVLSYLPLAHILERGAQEVPAITFGWHIFFAEGLETFLEDLKRARPTAVFLAVPRVLLKIQQGVFEKVPREKLSRVIRLPIIGRFVRKRILSQMGFDRLRYAACGAAPLPPEVLVWYRDLGLNLLEGYGLTEALITHLTKPDNVRPGYVGAVLEGVEAKRGENGELLLRSPMNMIGYYKDPNLTREAFTDDKFLRTGDIAEIEPDGQTKIVGRLKEQFKTSKGKYVTPAPIETRLLAHPDVESCCLMGAGLPSPFAVVVLSPEARQRAADPVLRQEIEKSLRQQLDEVNAQVEPHEKVAFIVVVNEPWTIANGMVTPTLKLRRGPLEDRYLRFVESWRVQNRCVVWQPEEAARQAGGMEAAG